MGFLLQERYFFERQKGHNIIDQNEIMKCIWRISYTLYEHAYYNGRKKSACSPVLCEACLLYSSNHALCFPSNSYIIMMTESKIKGFQLVQTR